MKKKLKIAQLTPYYFPSIGGVEVVVQYVSEELVRRGHEVHVLTAYINHKSSPRLTCPVQEEINGVQVYRFLPLVRFGHFSFSPGMLKKVLGTRYDILHSHCYRQPQGELARLGGFISKTPTILHMHGGFQINSRMKCIYYNVYDFFAKLGIANRFNHYISLTDFISTRLNLVGVKNKRISIIPNAAENDSFTKIQSNDFCEKYGIAGKKIFLYLGHLIPDKSVDLLIRALPRIIKREPNAFLALVGPDGRELERLKVIAEELNVSQYFKWLGPLHGLEKHKAFDAAEFFVLPSHNEGFPLVLLEAMAHKKPTIGVDAPGPRDIISPGQTGFIVKPGDVDGLAMAILDLLEDSGLCSKIGQKAREVAQQRYSITKVVDQIENLYYDIINES